MTEILNLDTLRATRSIVLNGRTRVVRSMTVAEFIAAADFDVQFEAADVIGKINLLIDVITRHADIARDELMALDLGQLMALMQVVRGQEGNGGAGA